MSKWTPILKETHANHTWLPRQGFAFAADNQLVEVLITEVSRLIPHYTLGFVASEGSYRIAALLGLGGEHNLFVNTKKQWCCQVVPLALQSYPFAHIKNIDTEEYILCIEEKHLSDSDDGAALFTETGDIDPNVSKVIQFLEANQISRVRTIAACDALANAGLIEPWPIEINTKEGEKPARVEGFHRISEQAFDALDPESLSQLRDVGALVLAYAHFFSSGNIQQMQVRVETLAKEFAEAGEPRNTAELFDDQGTINFGSLDEIDIL